MSPPQVMGPGSLWAWALAPPMKPLLIQPLIRNFWVPTKYPDPAGHWGLGWPGHLCSQEPSWQWTPV